MTFPSNHSHICIIPRVSPFGGPGTFSAGLISGLTQFGIPVSYDLSDPSLTSVLVIGGSRSITGLLHARQQGKRIVQRLNGMNWMHRAAMGYANRIRSSVRYFIRSEINNLLLASIRKWLADHIIYQSQFSKDWWNRVYGEVKAECSIVYNAVDLEQFTPAGPGEAPIDFYRILMVEGNISGGYQMGLENAVNLAEQLQSFHKLSIELKVVGNVPENIQARWQNHPVKISWTGILNRDQIPFTDRSAHLLFSSDLNAACPNSVIEALACGLPVLSYDTGALKELVPDEVGRVIPYGRNHWKLDPPLIPPLAAAAVQIFDNQPTLRQAARSRAVSTFGLQSMVASYIKILCA